MFVLPVPSSTDTEVMLDHRYLRLQTLTVTIVKYRRTICSMIAFVFNFLAYMNENKIMKYDLDSASNYYYDL